MQVLGKVSRKVFPIVFLPQDEYRLKTQNIYVGSLKVIDFIFFN